MSIVTALRAAFAAEEPSVLVTITRAVGSTPREAGAAMLVTPSQLAGTIGGGRLEFDAIERARAMLVSGEIEAAMDVALGPAIGQCCGGRVELSLRRAEEALLTELKTLETRQKAARPLALIFGAGHTGRALATALAPLPISVRLVDSRPETLVGLPEVIETIASALPEAEVAAAPAGTAFVVMTHEHSLDFLIAAAALARGDAAYVGLIGSATKRERFCRYLAEEGWEADAARLTLPIGGAALHDKRPEVIAALTVAELAVCLLSDQQEKLIDRFAARNGRCHSAEVRSTG
ncbi:xanthine dehydrogenase accessory protein XdhC [Aurantimonas marianensis]|uniref:Xanthine dehydrogenase accessory protein XdhC n=1 Tax=Aurantimonas marianensis TaxID=2920428 RepID=A0A9X2KDH6_9HYPH|nr:xanthine dehydrogenase accessory protein XdhC [Aurantimonas marianensis]MCP3053649.1 xanthine dehydrogenase accessory protein XdhC [Aurantimonas marianensis]